MVIYKRISVYHLINAIIIFLGLGCFSVGVYPFAKALVSIGWPVTEGMITNSSVMDGPDYGMGVPVVYKLNLYYRYRDRDNRVLVGNRVEFGVASELYFWKDFAQRVSERYPVGKPVKVHFNPANVEDTVLEKTPSMGSSVLWIMLALGFFLVSLIRYLIHSLGM
ncbi:MAG: DUF3592 domain-containing protein [Magnetococcus sp. WYHC-3]